MIRVRLSSSQRDQVRRGIAKSGDLWIPDPLAYLWAEERVGRGPRFFAMAVAYYKAITDYRSWLERNYRTVRAQARAA